MIIILDDNILQTFIKCDLKRQKLKLLETFILVLLVSVKENSDEKLAKNEKHDGNFKVIFRYSLSNIIQKFIYLFCTLQIKNIWLSVLSFIWYNSMHDHMKHNIFTNLVPILHTYLVILLSICHAAAH